MDDYCLSRAYHYLQVYGVYGPQIVSQAPARRTSEPVCVLFCVQVLKKEEDALQNCYVCVISFK